MMEMRELGNSGLQVSAIGLGCNNLGHIPESCGRDLLHKALDVGITLFDTANSYAEGRSEECLGRWLGAHRQQVSIATKFGYRRGALDRPGARENVFASVEASLKRLRTDYIDLYQMHFPDGVTPIAETLQALEELVLQGKVRFIGCSNFSKRQILDAAEVSRSMQRTGFVSCQGEFNLLVRQALTQLLPALRECGLGFLPCFPLASGLLTGKHVRGADGGYALRKQVVRNFAERFLTDDNWHRLEIVGQFCRERRLSMLSLALSWLLAQPGVSSVIAGATTVEQLEQNVLAGESRVPADELACIVAALDVFDAGLPHGYNQAPQIFPHPL